MGPRATPHRAPFPPRAPTPPAPPGTACARAADAGPAGAAPTAAVRGLGSMARYRSLSLSLSLSRCRELDEMLKSVDHTSINAVLY